MKTQTIIPPDVAAYLIQAAVDVAKEQGFVPHSERDLATWHEANHKAIGVRAIEAMDRLRVKLFDNPKLMQEAQRVLAAAVYKSIPKDKTPRWSRRFESYAKSRGMSPDEVLKADGNMANYLCWSGK